MSDSCDICIGGGGPAGLMAAIAAARAGSRVVLLEKQDRCGVRLQAAGGGRGNLANTADAETFMARFGRQGRFMAPALAAMDCAALRAFFHSIGQDTCTQGDRVFPRSDSAAAVRSSLVHQATQLGVEIRPRSPARRLLFVDATSSPRSEAAGTPLLRGQVAGVEGDGWSQPARAVVLACGGRAWPSLGGGDDGLDLAGQAGHAIVPPTPALVPLICKETWLADCAGASLPSARLWIDQRGQSRAGLVGEVLFAHHGLSGPAVLDLSGDVAALLANQSRLHRDKPGGGQGGGGPGGSGQDEHSANEAERVEVKLAMELLPDVPADRWPARLDNWRQRQGRRTIRALLDEHLPASLASALCRLAGLDAQVRAAQMGQAQGRRLVELLTHLELTVIATGGFERAMVMRGGVSLRQVDPHTLRSKLVAGLYFAGELLDLDGPTGGYNLQWAFISGHLAGMSAGR